jgi:hypothetical protein
MKLIRIQRAEPLEGFKARLAFTDGSIREVDLEPYLHGPVFEPVRSSQEMFRAMRIEGGTVAWPNGADIDPNVLYHGLKPAWMDNETAEKPH